MLEKERKEGREEKEYSEVNTCFLLCILFSPPDQKHTTLFVCEEEKNDAIEERGNIFCGQVYNNKKLERETLIILKLDCKSTLYILMLED